MPAKKPPTWYCRPCARNRSSRPRWSITSMLRMCSPSERTTLVGSASFSSTSTCTPCSRSSPASIMPVGPPPTMITSIITTLISAGTGFGRRFCGGRTPGSDHAAHMRQRLLQQHPVSARHLALHRRGQCLLRAEPDQVERVLAGAAVAGDRDEVGERDRVLARVVVRRDAVRREVLRDGEGLEGRRDPGRATGPRSFSRCRRRASRTRSWCSTRPETRVRLTVPSGPMRSSRPMLVTSPLSSTRTGTASTYRIGMRARAISSSSEDSQPGVVSVMSDIA